jgi:hypothetical protein
MDERRGLLLRSAALTAVIVAPIAGLLGLVAGFDGDAQRRVERPPAEPSLAVTMDPANRVASSLAIESLGQEQRVIGIDAETVAGAPFEVALTDTDEAVAGIADPLSSDEEHLDLTAAASRLGEGLVAARTDAEAFVAAAAGGDFGALDDLRARYGALATGFEDAVADAIDDIDDPEAATAAGLSWHATRRVRAATDLQIALLGADPDPVVLTLPSLPDMPSDWYDPGLTDPDLYDPGLYDPGAIDPGLLDLEPIDPHLPPAPDVGPAPDLPSPPELSDPLILEPPPPARSSVATAVAPSTTHAVQYTGALAGTPVQEPPVTMVSAAPPGLAEIVARLRAAETALGAAPEPYDGLLAGELDGTAPLLTVADALLAGQPQPWTEVMHPPGADVSSVHGLAHEIVARYDDEVRSVPSPIVRTERDHSPVRGVVVGSVAFAVLVGLVTTLVVAIAGSRPPPAPVWPPMPGGPPHDARWGWPGAGGHPAPGAPVPPGSPGDDPSAPVPPGSVPADAPPSWHEGPWHPLG